MHNDLYQRLAEHLDSLPGGFPPSHTGADIPLLKKLFTPEEAELASDLTLEREDAAAFASRVGIDPDHAARALAEMAKKGLIFSVHAEDGPPLYQAAPFVVGIYEFQVGNLDTGLVKLLNEYWSTQKRRRPVKTITQMRTIPIGKSIDPHLEALPYQKVIELVEAHERFAVAQCICRLQARLEGQGCDALDEACLIFGEWADFYVRGGNGRYIELPEVLEILERADEENLVLQPSNSREIAVICCCCSCCCGILQGIKRHPRPAEIVSSVYIAILDQDLCTGCGVCLQRCQMDAITRDDDVVSLNPQRCIGCGLCVTRCPAHALTLILKPGFEEYYMPASMSDTWKKISIDQAEATR